MKNSAKRQEAVMDLDEAAQAFREFVSVIRALRTPGTGCPWDLEQDHRTLRPYLVEEVHEVLDAIDRGDDRSFREELGDLLLQVVLHAQVADDRGAFSITEVVRGITEKMVRRHPHVFGSERVGSSAEVLRNWEQIKAAEAQEKSGKPPQAAGFDRVPRSLPALLLAQQYGEKAAKVGFDWDSPAVLDEVRNRFAELEGDVRTVTSPGEGTEELTAERRERLGCELGAVLFGVCQLARRLGLNAEDSLRAAAGRFAEEFQRQKGTR